MDNAEYLIPYLENITMGVCPACLSNQTGSNPHKQNTIRVTPVADSRHHEYHFGDMKSDTVVVCKPCVEKRDAKSQYLSVLSTLLDSCTLTTTCTSFHNTTIGGVTIHSDPERTATPIDNHMEVHPTEELQELFDYVVYSPLEEVSLGVKESRSGESGLVYHFQTGLVIVITDDWSFEDMVLLFDSMDWKIVQNEKTIPYLL